MANKIYFTICNIWCNLICSILSFVGAGGTSSLNNPCSTSGGDSTFATITATGGGRGGGHCYALNWYGPLNGGSGGTFFVFVYLYI